MWHGSHKPIRFLHERHYMNDERLTDFSGNAVVVGIEYWPSLIGLSQVKLHS